MTLKKQVERIEKKIEKIKELDSKSPKDIERRRWWVIALEKPNDPESELSDDELYAQVVARGAPWVNSSHPGYKRSGSSNFVRWSEFTWNDFCDMFDVLEKAKQEWS